MRFADAVNLMLLGIYLHYREGQSTEPFFESLPVDLAPADIPPLFRDRGMDELRSERFIDATYDADIQENVFSLTTLGIRHIEEQLDDADSLVSAFEPDMVQKIQERHLLLSSDPDAIPASDRVVRLDHNDANYKAAREALHEFVDEAEKSNEFSELFADPDERFVAISEFRSGLDYFDQDVFRLSTVNKLVTTLLTFTKEHMPSAILGALASKALELLGKVL